MAFHNKGTGQSVPVPCGGNETRMIQRARERERERECANTR
jgi:hypothetical protein